MRRCIKVEEYRTGGRNTRKVEDDSLEDEEEIELKYKKSKQFVAKLVEENTHLRLMINKYIQVTEPYRLFQNHF